MYDGGLKATWAGPAAMGWCRTLNVLLGAQRRGESGAPVGSPWLYAAGVGALHGRPHDDRAAAKRGELASSSRLRSAQPA